MTREGINWEKRLLALVTASAGGVALGGLGILVVQARKRVHFEQSVARFEDSVTLLNSQEALQYNAGIIKITAASVIHYKGATVAQLRSTVDERLVKNGIKDNFNNLFGQLLKQHVIIKIGDSTKGHGIVQPAAALAGILIEGKERLPLLVEQIERYEPGFQFSDLAALLPEPEVLEFGRTSDGSEGLNT